MNRKCIRRGPDDHDVIILGAGISGLVAASILAGKTDDARQRPNVLVIDGFEHPGGNHKSANIDGMTFDIGSFFFANRSPFFEHFPSLLPLYENHDSGEYRIERITPNYTLGRYPYDMKDDILRGNPIRHVLSALHGRLTADPDANARDYARHYIGTRFYKLSGLEAYIERMFGVAPEELESEFARKRMSWIAENANLRSLVRRLLKLEKRKAPPSGPPLKQLVRPRGGFPLLYGAACLDLERQGVDFSLGIAPTRIVGTAESGYTVTLADGSERRAAMLISTIPVQHCLHMCGLPAPSKLASNNLHTLFVSFEGKRGFAANVLYNFCPEGRWKRLTMHSDFYGRADGREYFSVECALNGPTPGEAALFEEFRGLVHRSGLFHGNLQLEGSQLVPNIYPIYRKGATEAARNATAQLEEIGIRSFGRQGGFDYQPIAAVTTRVAETALEGVSAPARAEDTPAELSSPGGEAHEVHAAAAQ